MKRIIPLVILSFFLFSCDDSSIDEKVNYDRTAFLENLADNLIIPGFNDFATKTGDLSAAVEAFRNDPSEVNLLSVQEALKSSWLSYQYVAYFQVGPSADVFFRDEVNVYPASITEIEAKISSQNYDFTGATNIDVKGFPAVDYMINGTANTNAEIVNYYTDASEGTKRMAYLEKLVQEINSFASTIQQAWPNYRDTFVSAAGTDIGSSTGKLVNEFNLQFDLRLKNGKIGIPSGVKSLQETLPEKAECYYGAYSKELAIASAQAALDIFRGTHFEGATNGQGLDDYVTALNVTSNGEPLAALIESRIQASIDQMELIEPSIVEAAQSYNESGALVQSYFALQAVIPLIKVDMTSAMGVTITFQDNDGD